MEEERLVLIKEHKESILEVEKVITEKNDIDEENGRLKENNE